MLQMFTIAANISAVVRVNPQKRWQPETASTPIAQPPNTFSGCPQSYTIHPIRSPKGHPMNWRIFPLALMLTACTYSETPFGRYAEIDLPLQSQTTIHKTVTVNAPAGTTVNISETPVYQVPPPPPRRCYYDEYERRRVCHRY